MVAGKMNKVLGKDGWVGQSPMQHMPVPLTLSDVCLHTQPQPSPKSVSTEEGMGMVHMATSYSRPGKGSLHLPRKAVCTEPPLSKCAQRLDPTCGQWPLASPSLGG